VGDQGDALDVGHLASHCGCHVDPSAALRLSHPCCASTTLESRLPEGSSLGWAPDYPAFDEFVPTFAWVSRPALHPPLGAVRRTEWAKSRGGRPSARPTPSATDALRPSRTSANRYVARSTNSGGSG